MIYRRFLNLLPVLALVLPSCDDPVKVETLPTITGNVRLHDELANQLPDAGQVTVRLIGPDQSALGETVTSDDGSFEFEVAEEGPFSLVFGKEGFGTQWMWDVAVGGGPEWVDLYARSTAEVRSVEASAYDCGSIDCLGLTMEVAHFFLEGPTRRLFRVFMSTDVGVSWAGYESTSLLVVPEDQPGLEPHGTSATFELSGLRGGLSNFPAGATVHLVIHGATENLSNSFVDPVLGLEVFTDLSPVSARATVVMP